MDLTFIPSVLFTLALSVIGYFLKRTMGQIDHQQRRIEFVENKYATKEELRELNAKLEKIGDDVQSVKLNCISKEDFFIKMSELSRTLERMEDKMERSRQ